MPKKTTANKPLPTSNWDLKIDIKALNSAAMGISQDFHIDPSTTKEIIKSSLLKAYKDIWAREHGYQLSRSKGRNAARDIMAGPTIDNSKDLLADIDIDWESGNIQFWDGKMIVPTDDDIEDDYTQMSLEEAKEYADDDEDSYGNKIVREGQIVEPGHIFYLRSDLTNDMFGASFIKSAISSIHQKMADRAKQTIMDKFANRIGTNITGTVESIDSNLGYTLRFDADTTGVLSNQDTIGGNRNKAGERFEIGERVTVYLSGVTEFDGHPSLSISRTSDGYMRALLTADVPELQDGTVKIERSARMPGIRTKIMVSSTNPDVDPVGACTGKGGIRTSAVRSSTRDNESLDISRWYEDPELRLFEAFKPAEILGFKVRATSQPAASERRFDDRGSRRRDDRPSIYVVCENNGKKRAVGKRGSNVMLAGRLCGYQISVLEEDEAKSQGIDYLTRSDVLSMVKARHEQEALLKAREEAEAAKAQAPAAPVTAAPAVEKTQPVAAPAATETVAPAVEAKKETVEQPAAPVAAPVAPAVSAPVTQPAAAAAPAAAAPAVEAHAKKEDEEPVEHVAITGRRRVSLSALEEEVERERTRKPTSRPNWKKRKEKENQSEKPEKEIKTPIQNAMPIYTPEELAKLNEEDQNDDDSNVYDDSDDIYDDDSYYDDNNDKK